MRISPLLKFAVTSLMVSAVDVTAQVRTPLLVLDCKAAGLIVGIGSFQTLKLPDGQIVNGIRGGTRTSPDGVKMAVLAYSDGSILYVDTLAKGQFLFVPAGGEVTKCEVP